VIQSGKVRIKDYSKSKKLAQRRVSSSFFLDILGEIVYTYVIES
jgi:hypothetical protein